MKEQRSLASIVIPGYNVEKYVETCIESVLAQKYSNLEVIYVDDGSTDSTMSVVKNYERDPRVKIIAYPHNLGVSHARNIGLEVARGKYIYFLDADDYIVEDAIENLVNLAEKYRTDCIYFDSRMVAETEGIGGPRLTFSLPEYEKQVMSGANMFRILMENNVYTGSVCRQFWHSVYLTEAKLSFPEGFLGEDALFSFKAMLLGKRVMITNSVFHIYRRHGGTMSTNMTPKKAISIFHIYCEMLEFWGKHDFEYKVNMAVERRAEQMLTQARRLYFKNREAISESDFPTGIEAHLFKILLKNEHIGSLSIDSDNLGKLRKFPMVIVYGAGLYAMAVLEALEKEHIKVSYLAVTTIHPNTESVNGIPVETIEDLQMFCDKAIIVLGVTRRNRIEVIENLKKYQFNHYIELD